MKTEGNEQVIQHNTTLRYIDACINTDRNFNVILIIETRTTYYIVSKYYLIVVTNDESWS